MWQEPPSRVDCYFTQLFVFLCLACHYKPCNGIYFMKSAGVEALLNVRSSMHINNICQTDLGILVRPGATLDIHGAYFTPTWTRLSSTAQAGNNWVSLQVCCTQWHTICNSLCALSSFSVSATENLLVSSRMWLCSWLKHMCCFAWTYHEWTAAYAVNSKTAWIQSRSLQPPLYVFCLRILSTGGLVNWWWSLHLSSGTSMTTRMR